MKNKFPLFLVGASCALSAAAYACSCAPPPAPTIALEKASAVFVGRVTSSEKAEFGSKYQFSVSKKWKGVEGNTVSIASANSSAACGINFDSDRDYLVYAFKTEGDDQLRTNLCTRTKRAEGADAELAELGAPMDDTQNAVTNDATMAPTAVVDENGVTQINASTAPGEAAQPLTSLNQSLQNSSAREIRLNWKFNWKLQTFPPTIRSGNATALYNRDASTLTLYSKYSDALGSYVKHVLYRGVTDENLQQLADKYQSDDAQENFAYLDKLPQVGATATDLGSVTHKRRVFNLK